MSIKKPDVSTAKARREYAERLGRGFNRAAERPYIWQAYRGGSRSEPEIHFASRAIKTRIAYEVATDRFKVTYPEERMTLGAMFSSIYRSLNQVLIGLKRAGFVFSQALDATTVLRIEFEPITRTAYIHLAHHGDNWMDAEPLVVEVLERPLDTPEYDGDNVPSTSQPNTTKDT